MSGFQTKTQQSLVWLHYSRHLPQEDYAVKFPVIMITGKEFLESVKYRFSKCRFSAELERLEKIEMGGSVKDKPKSPGPAFSLCRRAGIDAASVLRNFLFAGAPPIEYKIEQTVQTLRWRPAKVAFDTVWNSPKQRERYVTISNSFVPNGICDLPLLLCGHMASVVSKMIADRRLFWGQLLPITDTESCCQKNKLLLQGQIKFVGMSAKNLSLQIQILFWIPLNLGEEKGGRHKGVANLWKSIFEICFIIV